MSGRGIGSALNEFPKFADGLLAMPCFSERQGQPHSRFRLCRIRGHGRDPMGTRTTEIRGRFPRPSGLDMCDPSRAISHDPFPDFGRLRGLTGDGEQTGQPTEGERVIGVARNRGAKVLQRSVRLSGQLLSQGPIGAGVREAWAKFDGSGKGDVSG